MTEPQTIRLGVDVGGTRLKLAVLSGDGGREILARRVQALRPADRSPAGLVACLAAGIEALASAHLRHGDTPWRVAGVGLGVPGVLDAAEGRVIESPNLPWLNGFALATALGDALAVPVVADNDANCVGWGEAVAGAGRGAGDQLCLALGTGVGGAVVLGGRLHRGEGGVAGELGHLCVRPRGPPCGCGARGCLEQYASQTGLLRMMAERGLLPAHRPPRPDDIPTLFERARGGDAGAADVVDTAGRALGQAIAGLHRALGVPLFVVAGGIAAALGDLRPAMQAAMDAHAPARPPGVPRVVQGTLGTDAGCVGAAALLAPRGAATSSGRRP